MAVTPLKKKLDQIAKLVNEASAMLKAEHGKHAYIYFEAEGAIHAMRDDDRMENTSDRQACIVESSKSCNFDCGAW